MPGTPACEADRRGRRAPPAATGARRPRRPAVRLGALAALAAATTLSAAAVALGAQGGPALNVPVPSATANGTPAPTGTVTARSTTAPAPTATTPATTTPAATTPATTTLTVAPALPPGALGRHPATSAHPGKSSTGTSDAAIVLAAIGALLVIGAVAWALARATGYEPRWTLSLRHSFAEAGYRASATWAELGDWMRLGR
jgi:hypothetical protein